MITLFRKIRQRLVASGSVTKYLLYAIGEILLVVIGILIALQVSNWNEERKEVNRLSNYYDKIQDELLADIPNQEKFIERTDELSEMNRRSLQLMNLSEPDSLRKLRETLGAVATAWSTNLSYPILTEFIENGLLKEVDDQNLKQKFIELAAALEFSRSFDDYVQNQYQITIEPFFIKNLNYQNIALERYQPLLVEGGPAIDYTGMNENLELWNIISLKLELNELYANNLSDLVERMEEMVGLLEEKRAK